MHQNQFHSLVFLDASVTRSGPLAVLVLSWQIIHLPSNVSRNTSCSQTCSPDPSPTTDTQWSPGTIPSGERNKNPSLNMNIYPGRIPISSAIAEVKRSQKFPFHASGKKVEALQHSWKSWVRPKVQHWGLAVLGKPSVGFWGQSSPWGVPSSPRLKPWLV